MSTQRTPPQQLLKQSNLATPLTSHGSDPQLHLSLWDRDSSGHPEFVTRRFKRRLTEDTSDDSDSLLSRIQDMFHSFESQQNAKLEKLIESMHSIKEQNGDIQKSIAFLSNKYDEALEKIQILEQKTKSYEVKIESLESKIEQLERNSRTSSIEIRNIPRQTNENKSELRSIIKKVGELINQPILDSEIQDILRLKTEKETKNHILVNFTSTAVKEGFIYKSRTFNRENKDNKLNTDHLHLPGPSKPIYIDESLTKLGRKLYYLARQFVKDNNYYSTWTSYGKIYLREKKDSSSIRIDTEQDLQKLIQK